MAGEKDSYGEKVVKHVGKAMGVEAGTGAKFGVTEVKKGEMPKGEESAYRKLRLARSDARLVGVREKRAKAKAEAEESKKK
jgi:large subunit ribosomal protein L13e